MLYIIIMFFNFMITWWMNDLYDHWCSTILNRICSVIAGTVSGQSVVSFLFTLNLQFSLQNVFFQWVFFLLTICSNLFVLWVVCDIQNNLFQHHISNASFSFLSCFFIIHILLPYVNTGKTELWLSCILVASEIFFDLMTLSSDLWPPHWSSG